MARHALDFLIAGLILGCIYVVLNMIVGCESISHQPDPIWNADYTYVEVSPKSQAPTAGYYKCWDKPAGAEDRELVWCKYSEPK